MHLLYMVLVTLIVSQSQVLKAEDCPAGTNTASISRGGGIIFFSTQKLDRLKEFYINRLGSEVWLDQGACVILKFGNMLFAFCESQQMTKDGLITFFFKSKADVDTAYEELKDIAVSPPKENKKYAIYHFYAKDPEGRSIEFQYFMHPVDWDFQIK